MRSLIPLIALICCCIACTNQHEQKADSNLGNGFEPPHVVPLNLDEGYKVNLLTGDSIEPLLNDSGDVLLTGIPIPYHPDTFSLNEYFDTSASTLKDPQRIDLETSAWMLPDVLDTFYIDTVNLEQWRIKDADPEKAFIVWQDDTTKTGVEFEVTPVHVPFFFSAPIKPPPHSNQEYPKMDVRWLNVDHGMGTQNVDELLTDSRGNVWMSYLSSSYGRHEASIARYDGTSFQHVMDSNGLFQFESINCFFEDSKMNIWISSEVGLFRYDGYELVKFDKAAGFPNFSVSSICEDSKGTLWFGTGRGLIRFKGGKFTVLSFNEGLKNYHVSSLCVDKEDRIWLMDPFRGVTYLEEGKFRQIYFDQDHKIGSSQVLCLNDGSIAINQSGGMFLIKNFKAVLLDGAFGLDLYKRLPVREIIQDAKGNIWLAGNHNLFKIEDRTIQKFSNEDGLVNQDISCIVEDPAGNILVGHNGQFISVYNPEGFTRIKLPNVKVDDYRMQSNGHIIGMTDDQTLIEFHFDHILSRGKSMDNTWIAGTDDYGGLWIEHGGYKPGQRSSILRQKGSRMIKYSFTPIENKYPRKHPVTRKVVPLPYFIYYVTLKNENDIWFHSHLETRRMTSNHLLQYNKGDIFEISPSSISSGLFGFSNDSYWLMQGNILARIGEDEIMRYSEKEGLFSNGELRKLEIDANQNVWFTDSKYLGRFDGAKFTYFGKEQGLPNGFVGGVKGVENNGVWFTTTHGLGKLESNGDETYDLQSAYYNQLILSEKAHLSFIDSSHLWIKDEANYLVNVHKSSFERGPVNAKALLKDIRVNGKAQSTPIEYSNDNRVAFESYPRILELPFESNNLVFGYSSQQFSPLLELEFQYKVEGLDNMWSDPTANLEAEYRNMRYGDFKFQVRAREKKGQWGEMTAYSFTIHPPWFHTWWARSSYAFTGILLVLGFVRWRTSNLRKKQEELEQVIEKRTSEVVAEKEKSDALLLNILPAEIAEELKEKGHSDAQLFDETTVLFTDFKGFTAMSEQVSPKALVNDLNVCFSAFDEISSKHGIEKIKTIGDAYMAAGGLPVRSKDHVKSAVLAALEMIDFIEKGKQVKKEKGLPYFEVRIGIHTGPVVAGIVGVKKFQYDIWGDTVNTASRMESSGEVGKVNISQATYELLKDDPEFAFENRGKIEAKGKGAIDMYFVSMKLTYQSIS